MSNLSETYAKIFLEGTNCAQAVSYAFCEKYGIEKETAKALLSGFGSGMRSGEMCGAVSGAIMIIGIANKSDTQVVAKLTAEFVKKFKDKFEFLRCADLPRNPLAPRQTCAEYVKYAIEILEEMGF